jgi:DNA-binding transcriptional MocR family regulator
MSDNEGFGIVPKALRGQKPAVIAVYAVLAMRWAPGSAVFPSHKTIALEAGISERTAQRALSALRDLGFVEWEQRVGPDGSLTSNVYRLTIGPGAPVTPPWGQVDTTLVSQGPSNETQRNETQRNESKSLVQSSVDGFDEWWALYPKKVGKGQARRAWGAAVKKAGVPALMAALTAQRASLLAREPQFIPNPSTWLTGERWEDQTAQTAERRESSIERAERLGYR